MSTNSKPTTGLARFFKETFKLPALLGVTSDAEENRNKLATAATAVKTVATAADNEVAIGVSRDIQTYIKRVQEAGLEFRRPVNDFLKLVKTTEDDHLAPLLAEKARVDNEALGFAQRERQRVADEERKRREAYEAAEKARLAELKRLDDERIAREAEAKRRQDEIDRKARQAAEAAAELIASARNKKQREEAQAAQAIALQKEAAADAERLKSEAALSAKREEAAAQAMASEQRMQDMLRQPAPVAFKSVGSTVKQVLRFDVTDAAAVYRARPELCTIEVKASAVKAVCFAAKGATELNPDVTTVPGLKLFWADDLSTRRR